MTIPTEAEGTALEAMSLEEALEELRWARAAYANHVGRSEERFDAALAKRIAHERQQAYAAGWYAGHANR